MEMLYLHIFTTYKLKEIKKGRLSTAVFSLNFSSAGKRPFKADKAIYTFLGWVGGGGVVNGVSQVL